ncbi:VOC family protein [Streptomyces sp. WMMB303]|uniref:VOC family protein n=1 Tax=unclassified Streptomyces TaxID=2593676 RepID=UPI0023EAD82E|nr:VOC family protein [Streptomyces sp. WMMB303]MDF4253823.1 VOC family protein [Streptomyces sp. WMMB303]
MPLNPALTYRDPRAAVDFLQAAFGFEPVRVFEGDDGSVVHAELRFGDGLVMLGTARDSGLMAGLGPGAVYVSVQDPDAHHARAVEAGAEIVLPPTDQDYGSREYAARDPEGNLWSFGTYTPTA